jgi:hypothetical protein
MKVIKPVTALFLSAVAFSLLMTCSFDSPKAPSWDVPLNLPILDHSYSVAELIENSSNTFIGPNGLIGLRAEGEIDTTRVGDSIKLPEIYQSYRIGTESLQIPNLGAGSSDYYFGSLTSEAIEKNGLVSSIAPFSFQNLPGLQISSPAFTYAGIQRGHARLTIKNELPVRLEQVIFRLIDSHSNVLIAQSPTIPSIQPNDTLSIQVNLGGKTISQTSIWTISGSSSGLSAPGALINANQAINLLTELLDLAVNDANLLLPDAEIARDELLGLDKSVVIQDAGFKSGKIRLSVSNSMPIGLHFDLLLGNIRNSITSEPLGFSFTLKPSGQFLQEIELQDYEMHLDEPQHGADQAIPLMITGSAAEIQAGYISLENENAVNIQVEVTGVVFDYLHGWLDAQQVRLDSTEQEIEIPEKLGELSGIKLEDARLQMDVTNGIQIPIRFEGEVIGFNKNESSASFHVDVQIAPGTASGPVTTHVPAFTPQNSTILAFLNLLPTRIVTIGRAWIGDGSTEGMIRSTDFVHASLVFEAGAKLSWDEHTIRADTTEFIVRPEDSGKDDSPEEEGISKISGDATKNLHSAAILAKVENHLPVGLKVLFRMATDSSRLYTNPEVILGPISLDAGVLDANGKVTTSRSNEMSLAMTAEDIEIFKNSGSEEKHVFISTDVILNSTNGVAVLIYESDFVYVQALVNAVLNVNED